MAEGGAAYAGAVEDLRPVTASPMLGRFELAKNVLDVVASLIGVIGGLSALAAWLLRGDQGAPESASELHDRADRVRS